MNALGRLQLGVLLLVAAGCGTTDFLPLEGASDDGSAPAPDAGPGTSGGLASAGTSGAGTADSGAGGTGGTGAGAAPSMPDPFMPDPACMDRLPVPAECARCVCSAEAPLGTPGAGCLELYQNCFEHPDPTFAFLCGSLITCGIEANCVGSACYMAPLCMAQIDAAAMFPAGGTLASCGMGEPGSNACRAGNLLGACINFNSMMIDGPCRAACM